MYTKSIIQQTVEALQYKDKFRIALEQLMDKYTIEDSVFVFKNNTVHEATEGYFEVEKEFDNLTSAISECNINTMGIRITSNNTFSIGTLKRTISECNHDKKVFDLDRLENVR